MSRVCSLPSSARSSDKEERPRINGEFPKALAEQLEDLKRRSQEAEEDLPTKWRHSYLEGASIRRSCLRYSAIDQWLYARYS